MFNYLYKFWQKELEDRASNDKQIQSWVLDFIKFCEKITDTHKMKKGNYTRVHLGRKRFKIIREI